MVYIIPYFLLELYLTIELAPNRFFWISTMDSYNTNLGYMATPKCSHIYDK